MTGIEVKFKQDGDKMRVDVVARQTSDATEREIEFASVYGIAISALVEETAGTEVIKSYKEAVNANDEA